MHGSGVIIAILIWSIWSVSFVSLIWSSAFLASDYGPASTFSTAITDRPPDGDVDDI